MNAETIRVMKTEVWTDWEGHVVNSTFPLHRFLGGSNHSAVFLTEHRAQNQREVAIKFVPADDLHSEAQQLVQWGSIAALSHPHLVRLFDVGRCQFGGRGFVFAVMEYAEQTLAEILPKRPLTADEAREMLGPTLEGLSFLHRHNLVHGQLKPANIVVVNDQLKLTSDTARGPGLSANGLGGVGRTSLYDPPELTTTGASTAGDIWALGITLVEALTQRYPIPDVRSQTHLLPTGLPADFVDTVRRCLARNPANRPTVVELEAQYQPAAAAPVIAPPVAEITTTTPAGSHDEAPQGRLLVATVAVCLLVAIAGWLAWRFFQGETRQPQARVAEGVVTRAAVTNTASAATGADTPSSAHSNAPNDGAQFTPPVSRETPATQATASSARAAPATSATMAHTTAPTGTSGTAAAPSASAPAASGSSASGSSASGSSASVPSTFTPSTSAPAAAASSAAAPSPAAPSSAAPLHQVTPTVPQPILNKIRGHVVVRVRVLVDPAGDVVGQFLENPGPSRYFARVAGDAAGEWKFAPSDGHGSRVWLLRFEFTRAGITSELGATP